MLFLDNQKFEQTDFTRSDATSVKKEKKWKDEYNTASFYADFMIRSIGFYFDHLTIFVEKCSVL